jgi:hypothetical protein
MAIVIFQMAVMCSSCSDPAEQDTSPTNNTGEVTKEEADLFMGQLKFSESTKISGTIPNVANTNLLRTNSKDTIYTMGGVTLPIRISHPQSTSIGGVFITVENATYYYDVPVYEEEESDTVSVIVLEVEPDNSSQGGIELPGGVPAKIVAYDQNNVPVDLITRVIVVEKPSAGCDLLMDGDSSDLNKIPFRYDWIWHSTTVLDSVGAPSFVSLPGRVYTSTQRPLGCCLPDPYCPTPLHNPTTNMTEWIYDAQVTAVTSYMIHTEAFSFYKNETFVRLTIETIKNFNAKDTDWCSEVPAYNERESIVNYQGTHNYKPGNKSISYITKNKICDDPLGLCGYGSRGGSIEQTCHVLKITENSGADTGENQKQIRVYVRVEALEDFNGYYFYT